MIPDLATAQADVRALQVKDFQQVERVLQERIKRKKLADSEVKLKFEMRRPPLMANPQAKYWLNKHSLFTK